MIEIVSPGNKSGKHAFEEFLEKSVAFIREGIHLLVIDLFPPTKRDSFGVHRAIWEDFEEKDDEFVFPAGKNLILASYNASRSKEAYLEPVTVGDSLPDMPLFLFEGYRVSVPLESTYQTTWDVMPTDMQDYVVTGVMRALQTTPTINAGCAEANPGNGLSVGRHSCRLRPRPVSVGGRTRITTPNRRAQQSSRLETPLGS